MTSINFLRSTAPRPRLMGTRVLTRRWPLWTGLAGLLVWGGTAYVHVRSLDKAIQRCEERLPALRSERERYNAALKERDGLALRAEWLDAVCQRPSTTHAVATVFRGLQGRDIGLTQLSLTRRLAPHASGADGAVPATLDDGLQATLTGVAASDVVLADALRGLAAQDGAREVRLLESAGLEGDARRFVVSTIVVAPRSTLLSSETK